MDAQEVVIISDNNNNNSNNNNSSGNNNNDDNMIGALSIVKGKRTKRQRPQSPIPFRMITAEENVNNNNINNNNPSKSDEGSDICSNNNDVIENAVTRTATWKDEEDAYYLGLSTTTCASEEEEEMAHCLILLAQGQPAKPKKDPGRPPLSLSEKTSDHHDPTYKYSAPQPAKFTSRKFMETPTTTGKSGYYVYECKTCSKTFASFQALGGHRASHKKPKNNKDDDHSAFKRRPSNNSLLTINTNNNNNVAISSDEEDLTFVKNIVKPSNTSSSSLSLQLTNRALYNNHTTTGKARVHECSICGAEFSSGQALGGHMRRHRGPVNGPAVAATPISAVVPVPIEPVVDHDMLAHMNQPIIFNNNSNTNNNSNSNSMLSLDLDLNLPAPAEEIGDARKKSKLCFEPTVQPPQDEQNKQPPLLEPPQQQQLVLSNLALVDCHYQF